MRRALGWALFLPVPVVLWLYTRAPLGVVSSLLVGVGLMLTHRLYARPYALAGAPHRCLWCAGPADGPRLLVREPFGETTWRACGAPHAERVARLLRWADGHAGFLRAGILGTLALFLAGALLAARGWLGPLTHADAVALFRLGIAVTVLRLAFRHRAAEPASLEQLRSPFPLHIQALIGSGAVLWLFRLVGLAWLALAVWHLLGRAGLA
jgi:hypothetical protein